MKEGGHFLQNDWCPYKKRKRDTEINTHMEMRTANEDRGT